ncbi:hypothetical protein MKW94_005814 [Papaver nudicaule]|uniref:F-box/LRR-repeat protein 12 n=1 Tax=Papaver nudicaule TaxID=74823 RepID=A0AA41VFW2_PAPNU|nr:hypothetical protein [Papaver nudicaule]
MNLLDDCLLQQLDSRMDRDSFGLTCRGWLHIQNTSRQSVQLCCSLSTKYGSSPLSQGNFNVSAFHVYKLLTRFPYLTSLSMSGCTELPDSGLLQLEFFGSSLQSLCLDCCFQITDTGFSLVASGCSNLKSVSFYRCNVTDIGLTAIAKSCLSLHTVTLSSITGSGFNSETIIHVEADSCKLDPDGISGLLSGGGLEYLNLSGLFWSIHGDGLAKIGQGSAVNLRVLNLRMCRDATDEAIMMISKGCPVLQEWSLAFCHEITITGWVAMGWNCNNLKALHVNRCRNFCDRGLQALQDGCKSLSKLHFESLFPGYTVGNRVIQVQAQ